MSRYRSLWMGRDGLRSVWSVLLYVLIGAAVTGLLFGTVYWLAHFTPADLKALSSKLVPKVRAALVLAQACGLLVATAAMARIEGRSWLDYGLGGPRAALLFAKGAFWGALLMAALVGALGLTHAVRISPSGSAGWPLAVSALVWAGVYLPGALVEELLFRGYPFFRLARSTTPARAAIVMSVWFGAAHLGNKGEAVLGIVQVVSVGLVYCLAVWRTGSLWWAFGAHAAWNWTQTFVFGGSNSGLPASGQWLLSTPQGPAWLSGGSVGPEGSVLSLAAMALMAWIIVLTLPGGYKDLRKNTLLKPW
ncbi:MAG TPA: CPBP family intramembrane glutamic endopeptidase [Steroidobacteraceae bacterium]|nr:CPBP family intramembrane glutamic endopeptidase [Steroidobacteraceae bacterium]